MAAGRGGEAAFFLFLPDCSLQTKDGKGAGGSKERFE
jgi:hypothetical protein